MSHEITIRPCRCLLHTGACLAALVLSHPYIWQSIFGPKIKGEPFWAWQQEFRAELVANRGNPTAFEKILRFLRIDSAPFRWIGVFPYNDPGNAARVEEPGGRSGMRIARESVARNLGQMPGKEQTIAALTHMLADPARDVRCAAIRSLRNFGLKSAPALPSLQALLKDADKDIPLYAGAAPSSNCHQTARHSPCSRDCWTTLRERFDGRRSLVCRPSVLRTNAGCMESTQTEGRLLL